MTEHTAQDGGEDSQNEKIADDGVVLQTRTTCQLNGVDDEWNTAELDFGAEIEEAIKVAEERRPPLEDAVVVESDSIWLFRIYWNENTDSVWVSRYGYHGGMEVEEGDGDE